MSENYQTISFWNLKNRMVQTEELNKFKSSFFKEVYDQAASLTNVIVKANENDPSDKGYIIEHQQTKEVQNVIAFTGRRGTGKTSAMLSFVDALAEGRYSGETIDESNNPYFALQHRSFYALQYVDSSTVSKGEDFFEFILYRMLQYLNDNVRAYNKNSYFKYAAYLNGIKEKIVKLYNHYVSVQHEEHLESVSSYSLMEKNIEKHNVRNEVIKLVEEYTEFLSLIKSGGNVDRHSRDFLLICIDDIDMANSNHLEILQCIYRYFMIPNVVVMITLNPTVINATVRKSFYSSMEISVDSEKEHILDISQGQTYDFIRKIVPSDMRISMPSWKKYDYRILKTTMISLDGGDKPEKKNIFPNLDGCHWCFKEQGNISPKQMIMLLLADRTKIFLDMLGLKIHFMEPDSLRNLYDLFYLLYHMKNINGKSTTSEEYHKDLEYNRTIMLNYLYFKMIPEFNFNHALETELKELQAEPMDRRGKRIWDYYYKTLFEVGNQQRIKMVYGEKFVDNEREKYKIENYCFGELFRCLYFSSRLDLFDKNFIKAILASFAFTLPQYIEIEKEREKKREEERKQKEAKEGEEKATENPFGKLAQEVKYRKLRDIFGYSFLGTWRRELYSGFESADPNQSGNGNKISITIDVDVFNKAENEDHECLKHLLYLFMLSTKSMRDSFKVTVSNSKNVFYIDADLDPTAFIVGTIRVSRLKCMRFTYNGLKDLTLAGLLKEIGISRYDDSSICRVIDEIDKDNEIDQNGNEKKRKRYIWFLLKNPDITYNVIKRTVAYFLYYSDANLQVHQSEYKYPYRLFKKFYEEFIEKFKEELEKYRDSQSLHGFADPDVSDISHILNWFITSEDYGLFVVKEKEDNSNCENLFYRYGCGMDWTALTAHLNNAKVDYYSRYYLTLSEAIRAELDNRDYELLKDRIARRREKVKIKENLGKKLSEYSDDVIQEIFMAIHSGKIDCIINILTEYQHPGGKKDGNTGE